VDITNEMLSIIKKPRFGYGKGLNPCMDCHLLMCQKACEMREKEGYDFIITGEVLGQRPLSQTKQAMLKIQKECTCGDYLLRPLSAKHLPPTIPEKEGWVKREALLDLKGRSRRFQMELAKEFGLKDYPSPAGGCLLTDVTFATRLKDLLAYQEDVAPRDLELLKVGRHFRLNPKTKAIVGRKEKENQILQGLLIHKDAKIKVIGYPGPLVLVPYGGDPEGIKLAAILAVAYSDAPKDKPVGVSIQYRGRKAEIKTSALPKEVLHQYLIKVT
jgi:tRNA U34 2-thiouridine synthase MnmA/TrmU